MLVYLAMLLYMCNVDNQLSLSMMYVINKLCIQHVDMVCAQAVH